MISEQDAQFELKQVESCWVATYTAMAGPCEIHLCCRNASEARKLASLAYYETKRIEHKFSRYRDDNIIHQINHSDGKPVPVDDETAALLNYAGEVFKLSDGMFDITSGVLRRAWTFKGQTVHPDQQLIDSLLELVGWDKVTFDGKSLTLRPGMEIDLGGIGKEYAVDKVADWLFSASGIPLMVNFGGDIRTIGPQLTQRTWTIGIEDPSRDNSALGSIDLTNGAIATSGDARRFCYVEGERLGHILDPRTGWPIKSTPRSVTVVADHCTEAGLIATLAILNGPDAEDFLKAQEVVHHCIW